MERLIDFSEVSSYDMQVSNDSLVLKLRQKGNVIQIHVSKIKETIASLEKEADLVVQAVKRKNVKLTESQVKEIRQNWEDTVLVKGTKRAAAEFLGAVYNCSKENIYSIIYRNSWIHV